LRQCDRLAEPGSEPGSQYYRGAYARLFSHVSCHSSSGSQIAVEWVDWFEP
jgi:hypothetical protein